MPGVARTGQDTAGGIILPGGNSSVIVNGTPAAVLACGVQGHGRNEHSAARMVSGSGSVFASGLPICRIGDIASCGHYATGSSNVSAG
jgi:anaerobic glycerol-3-phosphate dehydrogenase